MRMIHEPGDEGGWRPPAPRERGEGWDDPPVLPFSVCEVAGMWRDGTLTPGVMPPADPFEGEPAPVVANRTRLRVIRPARR